MSEPIKLLLIEDNDQDTDLLLRDIRRSGLALMAQRVDTRDGLEGALDQFRPDLIISDYSLPGFGGMAALEIVQRRAPETPFIFVSGTIGEERAIEALQRGATDYVLKDNRARLVPAIERALKESKAQQAHRNAERERDASEQRFRNAFDRAPSGMALIALDASFVQVNEALCQLLGYAADELLATSHLALTYPADRERERSCLYELLTHQVPATQFEKRYLHRDQQRLIWTLVSVSLLQAAGEPVCYLYQIHDVTQRKEAESQLARLAYFDPLTGLANRVRLREDLERLMALACRHQQQLAVVFIDLDRFKQINDSLGHEAGDLVLQEVAKRLTDALRESDCVARLGGDEFVLVLPEVSTPVNVLLVIERVREAVSASIRLGTREVVVTPSLGVSFFPSDGRDVQTLFRSADSALYVAKGEGRNRVSFFRLEFARQAQERLELESALRRALEFNELFLEYQPIVNLTDGAIKGFEALLRWRRAGQIVSPAIFIPVAEEIGLIESIGAWVLREACRLAAAWPSSLTINVNCSAQQFREDSFADTLAEVLAETGLAAERLCLELTESIMLKGDDAQIARFARLNARGIRLSIDDYGTGYSSLVYLKRYAPANLKIDAVFVRDIETDGNSAEIVSATIAMAHNLGIAVVAEGVETEAQAACLRAFKCDYAQGYAYCRPVSAAETAELIRAGCRVVPGEPAEGGATSTGEIRSFKPNLLSVKARG